MTRKKSYLTFTDQFCGAGGSSQGIRKMAGKKYGSGIEIKLALNHWKLAIETHQTNFPNTDHDCTDVQACNPRYYPTTDFLITSPECTNHSVSNGKKQEVLDLFSKGLLDPAAERSRATMWDVPRFAEYHQYRGIIVENVVDARRWALWDAWLLAMHSLGYNHKCVYINSMHCHPTPQSRDRMYIVFWKKGQKTPDLNFTPKAYCDKCGHDVDSIQTWKNSQKPFGKYRTQYTFNCPVHHGYILEPYYYASFNAIDWSNIGTRIGDRKKALSPKSIKRIEHGLDKYGNQSLVISTKYSSGNDAKPVSKPFATMVTQQSQGIVVPFIVNDQHTTGIDFRVKPINGIVPTVASKNNLKLVTPFIMKLEHSTIPNKNVWSSAQPLSTQTTAMALISPWIMDYHSSGKARDPKNPLTTVLAQRNHHALISSFNAFIHYNRDQAPSGIDKPVFTIATKEQTSLISFEKPKLEDCYYRMLKDYEIQKAMAFEDDYIILGNSEDKVKQCGNAVTPPVMEWLSQRLVESLN